MKPSHVVCLSLFFLACPATAAAAEDDAARPLILVAERTAAPLDEVRLKSGGFVKGTITELSPEEFVVILPAGKEDTVRVEWSDVDKIIRGDEATSEMSASAEAGSDDSNDSASSMEPEPAEPNGPRVIVRVAGDQQLKAPAVLKRRTGSATVRVGGTAGNADYFEDVCTAPCDIKIPAQTEQYTVEAESYGQAKAFTLSGDARQHTVTYQPGKKARAWIGLGTMVAAGIAGTLMLVSPDEDTMSRGERAALITGGSVVLAGGIVGGGLLMWTAKPRATVETQR